MAGIVVLVPKLVDAGGREAVAHPPHGMTNQFPVVLAIRKCHTCNLQAKLISLVGEGDLIALVRQDLANDLESSLVIIVLHLVTEPLTPQSTGPGDYS